MSDYREDCVERKAVRAGIIEQKPLKSRNKRPRPFVVEHRRNENAPFFNPRKNDWQRWGSYRTIEEARKAMETLARKYRWYEWRLPVPVPANTPTP